MPPFAVFELVKILLAALLGLLLFRRLEQVKSQVARRSDFSSKWADLFFDASHTFMVSVERLMTFYHLISGAVDQNDQQSNEWARQANAEHPVLVENYFRIQRLAVLAPLRGPAAESAATELVASIEKLTKTRTGNLDDLRREINAFNQAVRTAHAEMLASRDPK